jgi:hypothetical protein
VADELHIDAGMDAAMIGQHERGTTLIEVMIASAVLCTLMAGLMAMSALAISTTENQGHLAARATEYAQDKMEQLLALAYGNEVSDTRTFPASDTGGTGLKVGGSYDVDNPAALYVDYLDEDGNLCGHLTSTKCPTDPVGTTAPSGWYYKRVWKIENVSPAYCAISCLKRITVAAATSRGFGGASRATSYLTVLKSDPF